MAEPGRPEHRAAAHKAWGVVIIGVGKLATGLLLAAAGFGIFHYMDRDIGALAQRLVHWIRLDPDNHFVHSLISEVSGVDRAQLRLLGVGTFFYSVEHLIEGVGLVLRKRWAEYMTIIMTASLVPVEAVMAIRRLNVEKLVIIFVNILIVVYLVVKLVQQHRAAARSEPSRLPDRESQGPRDAPVAPR